MKPPRSYIKQCIKCNEVMPALEKVCYCTGGVIKKKCSKVEKLQSFAYYRRKWLYTRRPDE